MSLQWKIWIICLVMATNAWCSGPTPLPFPQGIRDPFLSIAYVQTEKAVRAIRLSDGNCVWTYPIRGRPIAVVDDRIAIQVAITDQSFRIDVLDKKTGNLIIRSENTLFSQTAGNRIASTSPPLISARPVDQMLLLQWRIRLRYSGGANPPPDLLKSSSEAVIAAKMDLSTGTIKFNSGEASPSNNSAGGEGVGGSYSGHSAPYIRNGQWSDTPWRADTAVVSLSDSADSRSLILEIDRSKGRDAIEKIPISQIPVATPPYVTGDGMYLLIQNRNDWWKVYSANYGRQTGAFLAKNMTEPCVIADRVYYRSEQRVPGQADTGKIILVSQDLLTGKVMWTQSLGVVRRSNRPKLPQ